MNMEKQTVQSLERLGDFLRKVPTVSAFEIEPEPRTGDWQVDGVAQVKMRGVPGRQQWLIEVKRRPLEPREAELLTLHLAKIRAEKCADYAIVVAPYISPSSAQLLAKQAVGFWDLSGNCRIAKGPLYIERSGFANPFVRKSTQRSLYTPAAERILRALLDSKHQGRIWSVRELAAAAYPGVSVGQAQKILKLLENWKHIQRESGARLLNAEALLKEWAVHYRFNRNRATGYYSMLNPKQLTERFSELVRNSPGCPGMLASFSAAAIWAPYVRQYRMFIYWKDDLMPLLKALELKNVSTGENVIIYEPYDPGVFYPGSSEKLPPVTCPVQTYLDLCAAAGRGEEAAEALFMRKLKEGYNQ